jgi:hypothetical protein
MDGARRSHCSSVRLATDVSSLAASIILGGDHFWDYFIPSILRSSTVIKKKAKRTIYRRMLSRLYLQLFFETNLVERLIIKIFAGRLHWIR